MSQLYDRVALIGLGLIASSLFWAMKRDGLAGEVVGYARSSETRATAREIGLCDRIYDTAVEAVAAEAAVQAVAPAGAAQHIIARSTVEDADPVIASI